MRINVTFEVEADLTGWAEATECENAGLALTDVLNYLRSLDPVKGQTFLKLVGAHAAVDLGQPTRTQRRARNQTLACGPTDPWLTETK